MVGRGSERIYGIEILFLNPYVCAKLFAVFLHRCILGVCILLCMYVCLFIWLYRAICGGRAGAVRCDVLVLVWMDGDVGLVGCIYLDGWGIRGWDLGAELQ